MHNSGVLRRGIAKLYLAVIASEAKQSSFVAEQRKLDCFVACVPRNDGPPVDDPNPLLHVRTMTTTKLDLTGLKCPLPALKTRKARDGVLEAIKFPREGAGLLSSLVDTDGLVELGEQITQVQPGETVGFLSYASLM